MRSIEFRACFLNWMHAMRHHLFVPLRLSIMFVLLVSNLPAQGACTAGNPNASVIESTPTFYFTDNGNGTITHAKTGLIWKRCSEGQLWNGSTCTGVATTVGWANALRSAIAANTSGFGGYADWRLPNKKELESIIEYCGYIPSINQWAFPATAAAWFWSSSSSVSYPTSAWGVFFSDGSSTSSVKSAGGYARLVRGGQFVDRFDLLLSSTPYDFNGNSKADLIWRSSSTGENYLWLMNGLVQSSEGFLRQVPDLNWSIAALGDLDADGRADVLWRNSSTGDTYAWAMSGLTIAAEGYVRRVADLNWHVVGMADFNNDGKSDVLWQNAVTGETYVWLMNGMAIGSEGYVRQVADAAWQIAGMGDLDGDGRADIVWRHNVTGHTYAWLMTGTTLAVEGFIRQIPDANWTIRGIADLSGDGKADIVWRNSVTGQNYLWQMDGLTIASEGYLPTVADQDWQMVGFADYDGDGKSDIVWRNAAPASPQFGQNYLWLMNGTSIVNQGFLNTVPSTEWAVVSK